MQLRDLLGYGRENEGNTGNLWAIWYFLESMPHLANLSNARDYIFEDKSRKDISK